MNEFLFDIPAWEATLRGWKNGASISAWSLISMLEGEDDETVEQAFDILKEKHMEVDMQSLPRFSSGSQMAQRLDREAQLARGGLAPSQMEETDPLRLYLEEMEHQKTDEDEEKLAERLLSGSEDAAQMLLSVGLHRVVKQAQELAGHSVLLLDLIQEGNIGLWEAIGSYTGGDYASHADRLIRNSLHKAMVIQVRSTETGEKMRRALQDYQRADQQLLTSLGRNPAVEEIAEFMNITPEQADTIRKTMDDCLLLQQAQAHMQPKEETQEDEMAVEDTAYFQMRQRIGELLSQLEETDAKILTLRFGLEKGLPLSAEETAKKLGMAADEVSRREAAALARLRQK